MSGLNSRDRSSLGILPKLDDRPTLLFYAKKPPSKNSGLCFERALIWILSSSTRHGSYRRFQSCGRATACSAEHPALEPYHPLSLIERNRTEKGKWPCSFFVYNQQLTKFPKSFLPGVRVRVFPGPSLGSLGRVHW